MPNINLSEGQVKVLLQIIARVDIKGADAPVVNEVIQVLHRSLPTPETPKTQASSPVTESSTNGTQE